LAGSFHPSELALYLPAGSAVSLPVQSDGVPDGAMLGFNARCTGGASLYFDGDDPSTSVEPRYVMGDGPWRRFGWTLRTPLRQYGANEDHRTGTSAFALRFRVTGTGQCVIDQVLYELNVLGCSATRDLLSNCREETRSGWFGGSSYRQDTGVWPDVGPALVDSGPRDTGLRDTGVRDVLDARTDATTATDATAMDADDASDATDADDATDAASDAEDASDAATDAATDAASD